MAFDGMRGKEAAVFSENLAILAASGTPIVAALEAIREETRSAGQRRRLGAIIDEISAGSPVWRAFEKAKALPPQMLMLVKIGERSGRLSEHLELAALQQEKDRRFRSMIRAAMAYPVIVLAAAVVIGVAISWLILPRLALVFVNLRIELPLLTRGLIAVGEFLTRYGSVAVPVFGAATALLLYVVFFFPPTRAAGQAILFRTPAIGDLMREVELGRFGHLMSALLGAGVPVLEALEALRTSTPLSPYRRFYARLHDAIGDGASFQKAFAAGRDTHALLPLVVQHMIVHAEQSGRLQETLAKIGEAHERKAEVSAKNLSAMIEPVLLFVVWIGVACLSLAVILPIYGLLSGLQ